MSDARPALSDEDVRRIAREVVRELRAVRDEERRPRDPEPAISETDRAAARAIARRHGLHVRRR